MQSFSFACTTEYDAPSGADFPVDCKIVVTAFTDTRFGGFASYGPYSYTPIFCSGPDCPLVPMKKVDLPGYGATATTFYFQVFYGGGMALKVFVDNVVIEQQWADCPDYPGYPGT